MNLLWLSILLLLQADQRTQDYKVFVTLDANGVILFTDTPHDSAKPIQLASPNTMAAYHANNALIATTGPKQPVTLYISQPEDHATVRDNHGSVSVSASVPDGLKEHHKIQLLMNGENSGTPHAGTHFTLQNITRGEHTLQLKLLDQNGKLIAVSPITTFYLHQASVISPN